jgi:hypothetical protein
MTVHRRSLLLSAATAFLFPACISITTKPAGLAPSELAARITAESAARATEVARKPASDFAIYPPLPARPGETVSTKPVPKEATTAQKPSTGTTGVAPAGPIAPPKPPGSAHPTTVPAGGKTDAPPAAEPGAFPLAGPRVNLPPEPALLVALRAHIENKPERAIEAIRALDKSNQDLVLALLPVLARGATANLAGDPMAATMLVEQLRSAAARLEPFAALRIEAATFCEAVHGFGRYTPWPVNKPYLPNASAQLYLEVRNLVSQPLPAGGPRGETFLTQARARVEVLDAYKNPVLQPDPDDYRRRVKLVLFEVKRYTRAPVQDFHVLYAFPVPATPGVYTVTVELSDATGRRTVRTDPVEFRVAAGP